MRDVIWTLIIIWLVYRLYNIFFVSSAKQSSSTSNTRTTTSSSTGSPSQRFEKASKKIADNEGEYVQYEEVKD
jgi:hypothetical protein